MSELNRGRAIQLLESRPESADVSVWIIWLTSAISFLLNRYINED